MRVPGVHRATACFRCVWRHTSPPPWQQSSFEWPNGGSWVSTGLEADGSASAEVGRYSRQLIVRPRTRPRDMPLGLDVSPLDPLVHVVIYS
jgi:hypothetical protein